MARLKVSPITCSDLTSSPKIVDATLNAQRTKDLSTLVSRAKDRIDDSSFYLKNARKLLKRAEFG